MLELVIGNRNYSSWSLRAWLHLRESGVSFEEHRISLFTGNWAAELASYSPAGRVPVLIDGPVRVWDSFAIINHVCANHAATVAWPEEPVARAEAQSVSAEMHSGFLAIRGELPQNIRLRRARPQEELSSACLAQIARVTEIWESARRSYGDRGPWLFGDFSIADVMFAPVALRFVTYSIALPPAAQEFVSAVQDLESIREWCAAASSETERVDFIDNLVPADQAPLTLG